MNKNASSQFNLCATKTMTAPSNTVPINFQKESFSRRILCKKSEKSMSRI